MATKNMRRAVRRASAATNRRAVSQMPDGGGFGLIYVLRDTNNPNVAKIGRTIEATALARAKDYGRQHDRHWTVVAQFGTLRVNEVEAAIHVHLSVQRIDTASNAREIFRVTPASAVALVPQFIIAPNDGGAALAAHIERLRGRLTYQAVNPGAGYSHPKHDYWRNAIRDDAQRQLLALDALERGITVDELRDIYTTQHTARQQELARLKAEHNAKWTAEYRRQSFWTRWFGSLPYVPEQPINNTRFPGAPNYAIPYLRRAA
jgi:hypothetical protein